MRIVPIVVRNAPPACVEELERVFHAAGVETSLFAFGDAEDRNASVAAALAEASIPGDSPQVWLVPFAFLEMEAAHKRRAAAARDIVGLPATHSGQRLYVVYDRAGPFPSGPYKVLALRNLAENILSFDALHTLFDTF